MNSSYFCSLHNLGLTIHREGGFTDILRAHLHHLLCGLLHRALPATLPEVLRPRRTGRSDRTQVGNKRTLRGSLVYLHNSIIFASIRLHSLLSWLRSGFSCNTVQWIINAYAQHFEDQTNHLHYSNFLLLSFIYILDSTISTNIDNKSDGDTKKLTVLLQNKRQKLNSCGLTLNST